MRAELSHVLLSTLIQVEKRSKFVAFESQTGSCDFRSNFCFFFLKTRGSCARVSGGNSRFVAFWGSFECGFLVGFGIFRCVLVLCVDFGLKCEKRKQYRVGRKNGWKKLKEKFCVILPVIQVFTVGDQGNFLFEMCEVILSYHVQGLNFLFCGRSGNYYV
jgi:hypothetical protein